MLTDLFIQAINNYEGEKKTAFISTDFTDIITKRIPELLRTELGLSESYAIKGSVGTGNWAETPWVAILDKKITHSTQRGYYVVYLINPVRKTMYVSLTVGWTQFANKYPSKEARERITEYCTYLCGQLSTRPVGFTTGAIDLSASGSLSKGYELGQILYKKYTLEQIDHVAIIDDLTQILRTYDELVSLVGDDIQNVSYEKVLANQKISSEEKDINAISMEPNISKILESLKSYINNETPKKRLVILKKAIRNPRIAKLVKESTQYICEVCGREPFTQKNGEPYAEADHIKPLGGSTGGPDSPDNMRCLCAQCHAIITHGSDIEIRNLLQQ